MASPCTTRLAIRTGPERLELMAELREGIARGELTVHYQPKLSVAGGEVEGVEALVRWEHPQRGLLPPGAFLEIAERSDLMGPLTLSVLSTSLPQAAEWRRLGLDLSLAVNIPAQTLLDHDLPVTIDRLLSELGLPGEVLRLEIKIDQSFVRDMTDKPSDAAIVQSTIQLARTLGLHVVAEGVETPEALEQLAAYGCDTAQGYLISRPRPADELTIWLAERQPQPRTPVGERAPLAAALPAGGPLRQAGPAGSGHGRHGR